MTTYSDRDGKVHVGIDVSKRTLDVCILREDALKGESLVVTNDQEGVEELLSRLAENKPGASVELAVMEATGRYERLAATMLAASSISVAIVNPRQARDFAKAIGQLAKTDKIDAFVLARFARAVEPRASVVPDEQAIALQGILARRRQLIEMLFSKEPPPDDSLKALANIGPRQGREGSSASTLTWTAPSRISLPSKANELCQDVLDREISLAHSWQKCQVGEIFTGGVPGGSSTFNATPAGAWQARGVGGGRLRPTSTCGACRPATTPTQESTADPRAQAQEGCVGGVRRSATIRKP